MIDATVDLHRERPIVDATDEQRLAKLPVGIDVIVDTINADGITLIEQFGMHLGKSIANHHHPVLARRIFVPNHLVRYQRIALDAQLMRCGGHSDHRRWILLSHQVGAEAVGVFLGDKIGRQAAGDKSRVHHQRVQKTDVVADATNVIAIKRTDHALDRLLAIDTVGHQLGDHRIVKNRHFAPLIDSAVDPHTLALGFAITDQTAGRRHKIAQWILGVNARLHRPPIEHHIALNQRQWFAGGGDNHQFHQIPTGHHLGHRMLYLKSGIHLQEIEVALSISDKLHRTGRLIIDRAR